MGLLCIGSKLYAESGFTLYHLYVETRNKPMYGSGRSMQDKLESGMGLPLMFRLRLNSNFRVVLNLIRPKFHHQTECLLVLNHAYDKKYWTQAYNSTCTHYKNTGLLRKAKTATKVQKTAAKGPFGLLQQGLLRRFHPLALHYHNSSIAAVTKNAAIDWSFSSAFGRLRRAEKHYHMRLPFGSSDLLAVR